MLLIITLLPLLLGFNEYALYVVNIAFLFSCLSLAWNILAYCGQISFGHAAYFGIGAYTTAILSMRFEISPWIGIFIGASIAMLFSTLIGFTCFKLRGPYFSLVTLAFAEILKVAALNLVSITNGPLGLLGIPAFPSITIADLEINFYTSRAANYYILAIALLAAILMMHRILSSKLGIALSAIRENEEAAEVLGIDTFKYKLFALMLSSFFTGLNGAIYAHLIHFLEPHFTFGLYFSAIPLVMSMFGGRLSLLGPVFGALILFLANELILHPLFPAAHEIFYGIAILIVILFMPNGIIGWIKEKIEIEVEVESDAPA
ncbi:MAG: branched-chain amino acid ABC transporter permease [Methanocellales archaeon]